MGKQTGDYIHCFPSLRLFVEHTHAHTHTAPTPTHGESDDARRHDHDDDDDDDQRVVRAPHSRAPPRSSRRGGSLPCEGDDDDDARRCGGPRHQGVIRRHPGRSDVHRRGRAREEDRHRLGEGGRETPFPQRQNTRSSLHSSLFNTPSGWEGGASVMQSSLRPRGRD